MATRQEPSLILVVYSTWAEGFEGRERGLGIHGVDHLAAQDLFPVEAILQPIIKHYKHYPDVGSAVSHQ